MSRHGVILTFVAMVVLLGNRSPCRGEEVIPLWPSDSAEIKDVNDAHLPTLHVYLGEPSDVRKPAIVIFPAGGYKHHSDQSQNVKWLNDLGLAVFVVKYRLPVHGYKHPAPLNDAKRGMRIVRHRAEEWGLDSAKIGVLGGSSGGHVATTLATHFDSGDKDADDAIDRVGCRPDFVILADAVITMQGTACHFYSRNRLLPEDSSVELINDLSNELQVSAETPPTFLVAGGQDRLVPAENSLLYFVALRRHRVAFSELHFLSHGGHGYTTPVWRDSAEGWLRRLAVLPSPGEEKGAKSKVDKGAWEQGNYLPE